MADRGQATVEQLALVVAVALLLAGAAASPVGTAAGGLAARVADAIPGASDATARPSASPAAERLAIAAAQGGAPGTAPSLVLARARLAGELGGKAADAELAALVARRIDQLDPSARRLLVRLRPGARGAAVLLRYRPAGAPVLRVATADDELAAARGGDSSARLLSAAGLQALGRLPRIGGPLATVIGLSGAGGDERLPLPGERAGDAVLCQPFAGRHGTPARRIIVLRDGALLAEQAQIGAGCPSGRPARA